MSTTLSTKAEQRAKKAEDYPSIFGSVNLTSIRENVNEILKLIGRDGIFREYTLHDANHIDAMLALVDKIIPEDTAKQLKTADWLMIVLSCYFHDLGMLVTKKEYDNRYINSDFPSFKSLLLAGDVGKDYAEALEKLSEDEREEFLYQEFVRENHAKRIYYWIQGQNATQYGDAEAAVDAINSLLASLELIVRDDLAKICLSHHEGDLFDLDKYQVNRVYGDDPAGEFNLHYAALILRSVDVLQIQKKRVPPVLYKLIDPSNPKSQEEWAKQAGVRAVKPKILAGDGESDTIEIHASFDKESAYFGLLAYLQQFAGKELEKCHEWSQEAQRKGSTFRFPWKQIDSSQVEPRGFEGRSYSFRLDQEKILKLLTGHTLYNDSRVAIREVLQNALDAVRFRKYQFQDEPIGKIEVIWNTTRRKLTIRDTGTGMTQQTIENFLLNVGSSFYQSDPVRQRYTGFSAISRFGIGVLSTFMIADEVQILTVHPDDDFARRLTLPSVVKSYLIKKLPKSDPAVRAIGTHGTEVILRIRRSAELQDVESLVRYWMVLPQCEITCKTDDSAPTGIGFSDVGAALDYYYQQEKEHSPWMLSTEVRQEALPGIDLAFIVSKSGYSDVWDFVKVVVKRKKPEMADSFSGLPGMCVEGVRVRSFPAGYSYKEGAPWVLVNLSGPDAPKTNVARSDIEQTPELGNTHLKIYSLLGRHIQNEFNRLLQKRNGLVEAAWEADFVRENGLERAAISDPARFLETMDELHVIALEQENTCHVASKRELDCLGAVWTVDSRLVRNLEGIAGTLGIDLPTEKIIETLGKSIEPPIPLPRVLGNSKAPLRGLDIVKIKIYPEERTHRLDICWDKEVPGRWLHLPKSIFSSLSYELTRNIKTVFMTRDKDISPECLKYDLVVWRGWHLLLASSCFTELLDILGTNERFAYWLALLIKHGQLPDDQRPILKDQLAMADGKECDELLSRLTLPFERRFGYSSGIERESHFF